MQWTLPVQALVLLLVLLSLTDCKQIDPLTKQASALDGIIGDNLKNPFFPVLVSDLIKSTNIITAENDYTKFGPFVQITLHSSFTNLLQEFYGTAQFVDDSFKSGGLVMQPNYANNATAQSSIAAMLGIEPKHTTDSELAFALLRYWKNLRLHKAETSVTEDYISELKNISRDDPDHIISLFTKYGTHFVSEITEGDYIYQVFVYQGDAFQEVESQFPDGPEYDFGYKGVYFRPYTKRRIILPDGDIDGYSYYVGNILAASKDPALENIIPFLYDQVYKVNSILIFLTDGSVSNKTNDMKTAITSLKKLCAISKVVYTSKERDLYDAWDEVLRASIFQKFGEGSSPGFHTVSEVSEIEYYSSFNPQLVTNTATSYTAILQDTFDLSELKIIDPEYVTHLFIFADVLELQKNAKLAIPGTNAVYLICREFISNSSGSFVPEILVGNENTNPKVTLIASSFKGTLKLSQNKHTGSHVTVSGGIVLKTVANGDSFTVVTDSDLHPDLPIPSVVPELYNTGSQYYGDTWLANSYLNGLQLLAITIETVYSLQIEESVDAATRSLNWMIESLEIAKNETTLTDDLELVLTRLLVLKNVNPNPTEPQLLVPTLTFPVYQNLYDSLLESVKLYEDKLSEISLEISTRKQTEDIIESQQELNENVLEIGKFLVGMVEADAEYYEDVNDYFNKMQQEKVTELETEIQTSAKLLEEVLNQTQKVNEVGQKLVDEVKLWASLNIFNSVLGICTGIGTMFVGGAGVASIPSDVIGIQRVARKVDFTMKLFQQISIIYDLAKDIKKQAHQVNKDIADIPDISMYADYFPSAMDWNDFDADVAMFTSIGYLTCCKATGAEYKNAATKLSARGRAFLDSQSKVSALQYEIAVYTMKSFVVEEQMERLNELETTMNQETLDDYQTNTTDLYELGNILQTQANNVRMDLARTYLTMDAALQYYYLKHPTPLTGYDTLEIQTAASTQIVDAIKALNSFPSKPHNLNNPIVYEIPAVRISSLTSKEGYRYRIPLASSEFQDYIRVRIREIKVTIDSIKSANKDGIYIQSKYTGLNFMDRGLNREQKNYNVMGTEYRYVYNYTNKATIVGNSISPDLEDVYAMMTPFGEWIFAIPELASNNTNVNITYSSQTTTLRIEFHVNVIFDPPTANSRVLSTDACFTSPSGTQCLLENMYHRSISGDWDVIMIMDAQKINELWKDKYDHQQNHGGFAYNVTTDYEVVVDIPGVVRVESRIFGICGSPLVQFVPNNDDTIEMTIIMHDAIYETKTIMPGSVPIYSTQKFDEDIIIESYNYISKILGSVTDHKMVVVDLSSSLITVDIEGLTGDENQAMQNALEEYFQNELNSSAYDLGTIDFDSAVTPAAFQPRRFSFTTGAFDSSSSGLGTLLLCIVTYSSRNTEPQFCEIRVLSKDTDTTIPTGYSAALYISSQVMFEDLILPEFTQTFGTGASVSSYSDIYPAYYLTSTGGSITFTMQYSQYACFEEQVLSFPYEIPAKADVEFRMEPVKPGSLKFSWYADWSEDIEYVEAVISSGICFVVKDNVGTGFHLSVAEQKKPKVGSDQIISFPEFEFQNSQIYYDSHSGWGDDSQQNDASARACDVIEKKISGVGFNIGPFSVFALTNLIFPNAKVINITETYFPGDLLVLGDIASDYNPNPITKSY